MNVSLLLIIVLILFLFRMHRRSHFWDKDCWCWTKCDSNMYPPEKLAFNKLILDQTCFWNLSRIFRRNNSLWFWCFWDSSHYSKTRAWQICSAHYQHADKRYCSLLLYKSQKKQHDIFKRNISENQR